MDTLQFPFSRVQVTLWNSLAATGRGHRTHPAVVAGLLGMDTQDPRNPDAMRIAAEMGVSVVMPGEPEPDGPRIVFQERYGTLTGNYLQIEADNDDGQRLFLNGESIGGGNIRVDAMQLDGTALDVSSDDDKDEPTLDCPPIPLTEAEWARFQVELPELAEMLQRYGPRTPLADRVSLAGLTAVAQRVGLDPRRFSLCLESALTGVPPDLVWERAVGLLRRWRIQVVEGTGRAHRLQFLEGNWSRRLSENPRRHLLGELPWAAFVAAIGIQELNASGGRVTAAPTGGASGTVPACVIRLSEHLALSETDATLGLLVSGLVGFVAFGRGYVSGARAGCGGEIGIAAMMAAASCAVLLGGDWTELDTAAALAALPWMGTECSPTLGLVEYPCSPRNGHAAINALFSAVAAFSVSAPYPADHHMDVIFTIGGKLPRYAQEEEQGHHGETIIKNCNQGCDVCAVYKLKKV